MATGLATAVGNALLADILAQPEDDGLRLIYADWLDEYGRPELAAFIRAGVQVGPLTWKEAFSAGWPLQHREATFIPLWNAWRQWPGFVERAFAFGLPDGWHSWLADSETTGYTPEVILCRGFVHRVKCPCADWLRHGPALVRRHPVQEVRLVDREPISVEIAGELLWLWFFTRQEDRDTYHIEARNCLPHELQRELPPDERRGGWKSAEAAQSALSQACLAWAKGEQE